MPFPATDVSVEKASTGTPLSRVNGAIALTDWANNGPMMISAPWSRSFWAPAVASAAVPFSSAVISRMFWLPESNSASWAAFSIELASSRVVGEDAEKGNSTPTRTGTLSAGILGRRRNSGASWVNWCGAGGAGGGGGATATEAGFWVTQPVSIAIATAPAIALNRMERSDANRNIGKFLGAAETETGA